MRCFGKLNFIYIRFLFSLFAEHAFNKINLAVNQKAEDDGNLALQIEDDAPLQVPDEDEDVDDLASQSE